MANPRVFISSTCYDLSEIRDSLLEFVKSYGFDPVLSERGDVYFSPDSHTHESCIHEVRNCDLFILIIGGRFGGEYISDKSKSITNAEFLEAKEQKIPIFTYVKRNVYSDHHFYSKNKNNDLILEMNFPSIEDSSDALRIFKFIDDVRKESVNNAITPFDFAREIISLQKKTMGRNVF
ncbi:DUF4062 domain-containing protein [Gimesia chilikensis]|uniref:DUF4062 domain-containing protein n=1 Tax=Gimesia chilikensis TaxID=2605989 RepID=UPI0011EC6B6D|nr:DUF4062 domain-containing protein [Gimesia chilikensis]KAA0135815.1 DUF4062 domain-containing protein [Gimesia chilikensis]